MLISKLKNNKIKVATFSLLVFSIVFTSYSVLNTKKSISYNEVLNSKLDLQGNIDYYSSSYERKIINWKGKISNFYSQASDIKFCIFDDEHGEIDTGKPCDWFWAATGGIKMPDDCETSPDWYCRRMNYILEYFNLPIDDEIYLVTGKIVGIDCGVGDRCAPDIEIIRISK